MIISITVEITHLLSYIQKHYSHFPNQRQDVKEKDGFGDDKMI